MFPVLQLLPACQLRDFGRKNSGEKAGHSKLDNLFPHSRLHISHGNIRQNKLSVLITMTAIHRAPRSVSVSATALFIPFQRHPATLAILVRLVHNFEHRLNLLALFLSSFAFQIIRDFGKLFRLGPIRPVGTIRKLRSTAACASWSDEPEGR